jgi:hypothetical protein
MPKFRKKPVVIEAVEMTAERMANNADWPEWLNEAWNRDRASEGAFYSFRDGEGGRSFYIETLEGKHHVSPGDWVIRGIKGELYPCKPDIFAMTYDPVPTEGSET